LSERRSTVTLAASGLLFVPDAVVSVVLEPVTVWA
jgi:hypothetical protein